MVNVPLERQPKAYNYSHLICYMCSHLYSRSGNGDDFAQQFLGFMVAEAGLKRSQTFPGHDLYTATQAQP